MCVGRTGDVIPWPCSKNDPSDRKLLTGSFPNTTRSCLVAFPSMRQLNVMYRLHENTHTLTPTPTHTHRGHWRPKPSPTYKFSTCAPSPCNRSMAPTQKNALMQQHSNSGTVSPLMDGICVVFFFVVVGCVVARFYEPASTAN